MKFNTVIIGGGLTGLVSGIHLMQQGQKCAIISAGQSALHFFSGSFDLLNYLPDGTEVNNPTQAINNLKELAPMHPYSKIGAENFGELAQKAESFLKGIGLNLTGTCQQNHYRTTPMGNLKPTWLSIADFATCENKNSLPWKKAAIFNIDGFLDFHPNYIAESFKEMGIESNIHFFDLPELTAVRKNPSEFRSTNIARVLDEPKNQEKLADIFSKNSDGCDVIILPACIGGDDNTLVKKLSDKVGKPIYIIPTFPPSLVGIRIQQHLREYFRKLGGLYLLGDHVTSADVAAQAVTHVYTEKHGDIPLVADNVILTTGSFFSQGLVATRDKVIEPIFNLDIDYLNDRPDWYDTNFFKKQNYQNFGVKTTRTFNAVKDETPITNLYVAGAMLNGFSPIKEGCGGGVSILSGLYIAEQILIKESKNELVTK